MYFLYSIFFQKFFLKNKLKENGKILKIFRLSIKK